ncbi:MAG: ATP-binding cassette domain-containing protein [Saprospiraceae bacterium]|nr:ATP-binding cassette domain-containing protein [Candidatus Vicinibacter affinis]MBK7303962.1 ATP-binding cassette domain-containing protein [Candidatus Vicinibacter affinis]MBK7694255.1 ATP-binding cassette domain-containing protein [Candidatus Vicinibacter affinis]MBK8644571.1 ATP-binding cassette domain-containing protein [Candidatus Vicinibacter affinis]MBK9641042.1 ATP-binding cassette domain-containing protein [Candidatus Vicinibacter affinis]
MQKEEYNLDKLFEFIKLERREITSIYFYAILSGLIQLSLPLGIQAILGFVLGATLVTSVFILIIIIIIGVILVGYFQINQMKIIEKIQQKIFVRYAFDFAETIPRLDLKEIDHYYLPEKINRFFDVVNVQKSISKILLDMPTAIIQIALGLILLSLYHSLFFLFSLTLIFITWVLFKLTSKKGLETSMKESNYKYKVLGWLEEMGRVIKSIKYSQGTNINLIKTDEKLEKYLSARTAHFNVLLFQFKSLLIFKIAITAVMLILGSYLLFNQKINIGQFVAAEIVIITIINSLEKLIISLEHIYDVITGLYKLDSVLNDSLEKDGKIDFKANELKIEINNLSFSYNENQKVFTNLSLLIHPNSITCISGEENSGKSTLLKLLTGAYKSFDGYITLNDIPLQNYTLQSLRKQTGVLLYEQELFEGTVFENISLGKKEITTESIMELSKKLGFENIIHRFPSNLTENIDPLGKSLPTSVTRKILLLQSLIHNPLLIIMEEPWIGLDENVKKRLQAYLLEESKNKTIVVSTNDNDFANLCKHHIHLNKGNAIIKK